MVSYLRGNTVNFVFQNWQHNVKIYIVHINPLCKCVFIASYCTSLIMNCVFHYWFVHIYSQWVYHDMEEFNMNESTWNINYWVIRVFFYQMDIFYLAKLPLLIVEAQCTLNSFNIKINEAILQTNKQATINLLMTCNYYSRRKRFLYQRKKKLTGKLIKFFSCRASVKIYNWIVLTSQVLNKI